MPRYIDADALIDFLDVGHLRHPSELCFSEVDVANLLLHAPALSPEEVRGVVKVNYEHGDYSCSACGHPARRLSFARKKYCDECGAKLLWEVSEDA